MLDSLSDFDQCDGFSKEFISIPKNRNMLEVIAKYRSSGDAPSSIIGTRCAKFFTDVLMILECAVRENCRVMSYNRNLGELEYSTRFKESMD